MTRQTRGGATGGRAVAQTEQSRDQLAQLIAQRDELKAQLEQLATRRELLVGQLGTWPDDAVKHDVEARLREINARSSRLDEQIAGLNNRIIQEVAPGATPPAPVDVPRVTVPEIRVPSFGFPGEQGPTMRELAGIMAAEMLVLALIGLAVWRVGMRRMRSQIDRILAGQTQDLKQLMVAVDVIGVEVERISEGQRYVAKVLSDGSASATALPAHKIPEPARDR